MTRIHQPMGLSPPTDLASGRDSGTLGRRMARLGVGDLDVPCGNVTGAGHDPFGGFSSRAGQCEAWGWTAGLCGSSCGDGCVGILRSTGVDPEGEWRAEGREVLELGWWERPGGCGDEMPRGAIDDRTTCCSARYPCSCTMTRPLRATSKISTPERRQAGPSMLKGSPACTAWNPHVQSAVGAQWLPPHAVGHRPLAELATS